MKGFKVFIVLGCMALLIAACALPLGEDYLLTRDGNDITYIADYNLQTYVPIPKTGEGPITVVNNRGDLEVSVIWKDSAGTKIPLPFDRFLANTVYQAEIRITAKSGYGFYPSTPFAYPDGKITNQNDDLGSSTRIIAVTYNNSDDADITFITDYNLQNYVPIPMEGDEPVQRVASRGDVTVEADWEVEDPLSPGSFTGAGGYAFAIGTVYRADIRLKANPGYRFMGTRNFEYPAGTVTGQPNPDDHPEDRDLTWVTYKETKTPTVINDLNLTPYIPKPVNGIMPISSFAGPLYTGRVIWQDVGSQAVQTGFFQAGREYRAEVILTPAMGYTFTGVEEDGFIHTGAVTVSNPEDSGTVSIGFSATPSVGGPTVVYDTDLTGRIPLPIGGESPVRGIAGNQYTGSVAWIPSPHSTFQYGTVYTAVVALNAAPGYTFTGMGQNVFTHGDGSAVNAAGSGTVTIAFPSTASATYQVITSFGPVETEGSALKMMTEKKDDNNLTIDLPGGVTEELTPGAALTAGSNSPAKVIINGHGRVLTIRNTGTLLTVGSGVTLTLRNITLLGKSGNNAPLVRVQHGGKLILGEGVTLKDNKTTADAGGAWVNGGELVLNYGAVIKGMAAQRGGGALIDAGGTLSMNSGSIDSNEVSGVNAGGGVLVMNGSFNMYSGTIQSNTTAAANSGGGVLIMPNVGYPAVYQVDFNMYGGIIQWNHAAADESGGGVLVEDGSFNMYGGTIQSNTTAAANSGGGVLSKGHFTMAGTAKIDKDNAVRLFYRTIIIGGNLSANPAADIFPSGDTRLLEASSRDLIEDNYYKFLYDGDPDCFDPVPLESYGTWYGCLPP
jgi:hypothetical protein